MFEGPPEARSTFRKLSVFKTMWPSKFWASATCMMHREVDHLCTMTTERVAKMNQAQP